MAGGVFPASVRWRGFRADGVLFDMRGTVRASREYATISLASAGASAVKTLGPTGFHTAHSFLPEACPVVLLPIALRRALSWRNRNYNWPATGGEMGKPCNKKRPFYS